MAIVFGAISGAEPSTVTFQVETVVIDHNSTLVQREILVIGDPQSSNGLARVTAAPPASTEFGQLVRIVSGPSSVADFAVRAVLSSTNTDNPVRPVFSSTATDNPVRAVWSSTKADNLATVYQSSAADLNVTVAGYVAPSTTVSVANQVRVTNSSALEFVVRPIFSSTNTDNPVRAVLSSTAADNPVTVANFSTTVSVANQVRVSNSTAADFVALVNLRDGSGNAIASDVAFLSSASRGLAVREVMPGLDSFAASSAFNNSTAITLVSSGASARGFVYAYSITSTIAGPISVNFYDGATMKWTVLLAAISSAISGANLAVTPPAYLFKSSTGSALTVNVASSNTGMNLAVSYFQST